MEKEHFDTVIVGGGVATQYLMAGLDVLGKLDILNERGVAIIDPQPFTGGLFARLSPSMTASVPPADFLSKLEASRHFKTLLDTPEGRKLQENGDRFPTFGDVADFLKVFGNRIRMALDSNKSCIIDGTVTHITYNPDPDSADAIDRFTVHFLSTSTSQTQIHASKLILATGTKEREYDFGKNKHKVTYSSEILTESNVNEIRKLISENPHDTIVICGSGSSAFAVAEMLKDCLSEENQLLILYKKDLKVNLPIDEARQRGVEFHADDVADGQIYPHVGLKDSRLALWREIKEGREKRIALVKVTTEDEENYYNKARLIISATGQSANKVKLVNQNGEEVGPVPEGKRIKVNNKAQIHVWTPHKTCVPVQYGFALGSGHSPSPPKLIQGMIRADVDPNAKKRPLDAVLGFATVDALILARSLGLG